MATYNGHKNYNRWNVSLWIGNDEGLYNLARDAGKPGRCWHHGHTGRCALYGNGHPRRNGGHVMEPRDLYRSAVDVAACAAIGALFLPGVVAAIGAAGIILSASTIAALAFRIHAAIRND